MGAAYDNASSAQATGVSSITIPAFTIAGADRLCFVGVGSSATAADNTTSVIRNTGVAYKSGAVQTSTTATTSATVNIPAGVASDDLLFLLITSRDATGTAPTVTDNDTGGNTWAKIANDSNNKGTLWWKRATSGTASKAISISGAVGSVASTLTVYERGDTGATPYTDIAVESNASADETHAGFTPSNAGSMICLGVCNTGNDNACSAETCTDPGTLTEQQELLNTGGSDCASMQASAIQLAGPTATGNFTWSQTNGTTISIVWAIKSAVAPESFTEDWDVKPYADNHSSGHHKTNPSTGSYSIVVVLGGSDDEVCAGAVSLTGVHQTTPLGTPSNASGTSGGSAGTATVSPTANDDDWIIDVLYAVTTAVTVGADQTSRWKQENIQTVTSGACSTQPGNISNDTMSWTSTALGRWSLGAVAVKPSGISGTLSKTLGALTDSGAGTVKVSGTSSKTLGALTNDSDGAVKIVGGGSKTLGALTTDADGAVKVIGIGSKTLGAATCVGSGTVSSGITGSLVKTLGAATCASAGKAQAAGTLAKTLSSLTDSSAGKTWVAGTASKTLVALTDTGSGTVKVSGTSSKTLGDATADGAGTVISGLTGTLNKTLGALSLEPGDGVGHVPVVGGLSKTLPAVTLDPGDGVGHVPVVGGLAKTLGTATLTSAGQILSGITGTLSKTLAAASASSTGAVPVTGTLSKTLAACTVTASGSAPAAGILAKTLGTLTCSSAGTLTTQPITGGLAQALGAATIEPGDGIGAVPIIGGLAATLGAVTSVPSVPSVPPTPPAPASPLTALSAWPLIATEFPGRKTRPMRPVEHLAPATGRGRAVLASVSCVSRGRLQPLFPMPAPDSEDDLQAIAATLLSL